MPLPPQVTILNGPTIKPPTEMALGQQPQLAPPPNIQPTIAPEAYKLVEKFTDADMLFMNKMTRILYSSQLVRSRTQDMDSPFPGYSLVKLGGKEREIRSNVNFLGYITFTNSFLLSVSDVASTSDVNPDTFDIYKFTFSETMALMTMLCTSRREWEFNNPKIIRELGLAIYKNILFVGSRSMNRNRSLLHKLFHPNVFQAANAQVQSEQEKPKLKWL